MAIVRNVFSLNHCTAVHDKYKEKAIIMLPQLSNQL